MDLFKLKGRIVIDNSEANDEIDDTTEQASKASEKINSGFKKVGAAIATYLTVDVIKTFGAGCINAAADADAMASQFSQVFGDLESSASDSLNNISESAGINQNRMKGSFTKIAAFAKTTGMDTESALGLSERAMVAVADSAAFYDRSLEDTTESLQSFLKGNYENDAALGLSCTETTRNAAANKLFGESFKDLSESQKQLTLLQMVEDANAASGALGQAARESDTWTNVTGNLQQTWTDFQAVLGKKALPVAVSAVKKMTGVVQNLANSVPAVVQKFSDFKAGAAEVGGYIADTLSPIFNDLETVFGLVKDAITPIIEKVSEYVTSGQAANDITTAIKTAVDLLATAYQTAKEFITNVVDGFKDAVEWGKQHETGLALIATAFGTVTAAIAAYNVAQAIKNAGGIAELAQLALLQVQLWGVSAAQAAQTVATTTATAATTAFGAVMSFVTSPITLVILAIGALVAAGIALYKNWDTVKEYALELFGKLSEVWANIKTAVSQKCEEIKENAIEKWESLKTSVLTAVDTAKEKVSTAWNTVKITTSNVFNSVKSTISNIWNSIKSTVSNVVETVKEKVSTAWNTVKITTSNVFNSVKSTIANIWASVKTTVTDAVDGVKTSISTGLNSARITVSNVLNSIKSKFSNIFESAKTIVSNAIDKIKGFFDFSWSLPTPKLPHFSVSGGEAPWGFMGKGSLPSVGISWYKKAMDNAMILKNPSIFGYSPASGNFLGGGEAGSEVVSGTNTLMNMIEASVAKQNAGLAVALYKILEAIIAMDEHMGGNLREALEGTSFEINKREFARLVKAVN